MSHICRVRSRKTDIWAAPCLSVNLSVAPRPATDGNKLHLSLDFDVDVTDDQRTVPLACIQRRVYISCATDYSSFGICQARNRSRLEVERINDSGGRCFHPLLKTPPSGPHDCLIQFRREPFVVVWLIFVSYRLVSTRLEICLRDTRTTSDAGLTLIAGRRTLTFQITSETHGCLLISSGLHRMANSSGGWLCLYLWLTLLFCLD